MLNFIQDGETTVSTIKQNGNCVRSLPRAVSAGLLLVLVFSSCGSPSETPAFVEHPDFSGKWKLNREMSDEVTRFRNKLPEQRLRRFSAVASLLGAKQIKLAERIALQQAELSPPEHLNIAGYDPHFLIDDNEGHFLHLVADGREQEIPVTANLTVRSATRWEQDDLVTVARLGGAGEVRSGFQMARGGRRIFITTQFQDGSRRSPAVLRLVYDLEGELDAGPDWGGEPGHEAGDPYP